jgi:hypothetical protein
MAQGNIYTFTIDRTVEKQVEKTRKNKETGEDEVVLTKKKVSEPVEFIVKKPTRRLVDEAETQYAIELSAAVKKGIVTKAMLAKQYSDTGGTLTQDETKEVLVLMRQISDLENEYKLISSVDKKTKTQEAKLDSIQKELITKRSLLIELESSVQGIFQHTADSRAERALLLWYTIHLSYIKDGEEEKPFFEGAIYEEQIEDLYNKEESESEFSEAVDIFMKAVSYWFYAQDAKQEDIEKFIKIK